MTPKITVLAACALISAPGAMADISVRFTESAPKDRFTIQNTGPCPVSQISLTLDLAQSAGNLIFDTAAGGSGVEVFQPFEFVGTADANLTIEDGAQSLTLAIAELGPDASIAFTIDVDDQLTNSALGQIRVAGSEIAGAEVILSGPTGEAAARFSEEAEATLTAHGCSA